MQRMIAAVMVAAAAGTFGASDGRTDDGWRLLTSEEAEEVIEKARVFEQAERYRRRVARPGRNWYGGLGLVGDEKDSIIPHFVRTDGRRFRVDMPEGTTPVDVNWYAVLPRWPRWPFGYSRDILVTSKSQAIPGTSVVVRHVFGGERGRGLQPRGCKPHYASVSPVTLYARGFEHFLNGRTPGYCVSGDGRTPPPRSSSSTTLERGEIGTDGGFGRR